MPISFKERPLRLIRLCEALGYGEDLRSERYSVLTPTGATAVDVACFAKPEPKDMSTATMVGGAVTDASMSLDLRESARALAAPIALLQVDEQIELWRVAASPSHDRLLEADFKEERLAEKSRLIDALAPDSLIAHKRGLGGQLALFEQDVALLSRARAKAEEAIGVRIEAAMASMWPERSLPSTEQAEDIARTVVQALAVLVLRDKMTADRSFDSALAILQERYSGVAVGLGRRQKRVRQVATLIGEGVDFRSLDSTILSDVYEGTFLKPQTRRTLGAYYTPPAVARKVLEAVPVEEIAPSRRTVLDLTCGSGSLLLAAWDRLALAIPPGESISDGRLTGFDQDSFAVEIAKLAMVIHESKRSPQWSISRRDALRPRSAKDLQHGVVVGNPPWGYDRSDGVPIERATQFLEAMLDWCREDGYLACLLPASWLSARVASASRRTLRQSTDVLEVWRLPESTFELSGVASCVIFAQKRHPSSHRWLYRRVQRNALDRFLEDVRVAPGELVDEADLSADASFQSRIVETRLSASRRLADVSEVRRGVPRPKGTAGGSQPGNVLHLPGYGQLKPFDVVRQEMLLSAQYPEDFSKRGESPDFWMRPKVLMATTTNVDKARRIRAFLDETGVVPRNSMTAVVPKPNSLERRLALLAILNSRVVAEWAEGAHTRWIGSALLENLPIPDEEHWSFLAKKTSQILDERDARARTELIQRLETHVQDAYGVSPREGTGSFSAGSVVSAAQPEQYEPTLTLGTVLDVREEELLLHVAGLTPPSGEWRPPPPGIPGWACRPGVGFQVIGGSRGLDAAVYIPQDLAWTRTKERPEVEASA